MLRCLLTALWLSLLVAVAPAEEKEEGFRPLFNGTDLTGWEGADKDAAACWLVEDGDLVCTGKPGPWLRTIEQFGDYELRLEYKLKEGGNSGVYIRVPKNGNHHGDNAGIEVQILDDNAARYKELKAYQYSGSLYAIVPADPRVSKPAGEWNTMTIRCEGTKYEIHHNGQQVIKSDETAAPELARRLTKGYLGLQNHNEEVRFRNVRIKVLAPAEDWPEFRGPTGQGISSATNLPSEWGPDKNVKWKTALPGLGWSSPVLVKGKIYLTTAVPAGDGEKPDQSLRAICVDAKTGNILWNEEVFLQDGKDAPGIHGKNSHASPTPIVVDDRLYVHFGHMGTACLDLQGKPVWTNRDLAYRPVHGNGGSPVLVDGLLSFTADGASDPVVVALDAATGDVRWKYSRPPVANKSFSFATPLVIEVAGQKQIIAPGAGTVAALDPKDGAEIWRVSYGDGYSVIPRPVFAHGLLFLSSGYDEAVAYAIRPDGRGDVTKTHVAWESKRGAPHTPSMLVVGDELYMVADDGIAVCLDARTGEQHWQQRIGGNYSASPVYADGKIYLVSEEGKGTVIAPGKKYKKLATNGFEERTLASYAIGDGAIFVRTAKNLYRVQE